jgi:hypothetical protein
MGRAVSSDSLLGERKGIGGERPWERRSGCHRGATRPPKLSGESCGRMDSQWNRRLLQPMRDQGFLALGGHRIYCECIANVLQGGSRRCSLSPLGLTGRMHTHATSANTVCRRPPEDTLVDGRGRHDARGPGRQRDLSRQPPGMGTAGVSVERPPTLARPKPHLLSTYGQPCL